MYICDSFPGQEKAVTAYGSGGAAAPAAADDDDVDLFGSDDEEIGRASCRERV